MRSSFIRFSLLAATAISLLTTTGAKAETITDSTNLRDSNVELFDLFNDSVNTERLALDESLLPELFADSLRWDGISDDVDVFFINEGAGYRNQLLYSINGGEKTTLFDDIASTESIIAEQGDMRLGDGKSIGALSGNKAFDFFVKADGARNQNGNIYGADAASNADGLQHLVARELQHEGDNWVLLGFEDLYGVHINEGGWSDRDFNDVVIAVRGLTGDRVTPEEVPEPMTAAGLLVFGALGLAQSRRRQSAS